jgi:sugar O-acyltransferase (sialic acid O-acetyltransferase NeuD family)
VIYLVGAGGHAAEVLDALRAYWRLFYRSAPPPTPGDSVAFVVETNEHAHDAYVRWGGDFSVYPHALEHAPEGSRIILAVGDPRLKARLVKSIGSRGPTWASAQHPTAYIAPPPKEEPDWPGRYSIYLGALAYIGPKVKLGEHVHVNRGAMVSHDCVVGDFVHVAPGAQLLGACEVGAETEIGSNAVVLPKRKVGARCRVGAGAVVTRDIPDNAIARGNPARVVEFIEEPRA